jgi:glycosyltransferase 2 family protein
MKRFRPHWSFISRLAFVSLLLVLVLRTADITAITRYFTLRLLGIMLSVQPLVLGCMSMFALRLALLVRTPAAPFIPTFKAVTLAIGMNAVLPGRIAELLKPTFLMKHIGLPMSEGLAALFLERMADAIILGFVALTSVSVVLGDGGRNIVIALMLAVAAILAFFPRLQSMLQKLNYRLPWPAVHDFLENFIVHASVCIKSGSFYKALLMTIAAWLFDFIAVALFLHAAGSIPLGLSGTLMVFAATTIGAAIPALPGGLGTYEAAAVFSLEGFGYSFEEALALGMALHVTLFALAIIGSLVVVTTEKIGITALVRNITRVARTGREP